MSKWYAINDFDQFVDHARSLVFKFFGVASEEIEESIHSKLIKLTDSEMQELDQTLSHSEAALIIKGYAKSTKDGGYKINTDILYTILEELNSRLVSNILTKLVSKGMVDTAYDSEINDFVFWVKENDNKNEKDLPETD